MAVLSPRLVASGGEFTLDDWAQWMMACLPLMIAAIAQSQVVLSGGQGLAAGSTALFVNALLVRQMDGETGSILFWALAGPLLGGAIGLCNGYLIGFRRLPSTAVTMATGFVLTGLTLQLAGFEGLTVPDRFRGALLGDLPGGLPVPLVAGLVVLAIAIGLDRWRPGRRIRAAGRDIASPAASGHAAWILAAYVIAGIGYGASGVFLAAEIGSAEPTISAPSLLEIYTALILGGSAPRLCQGSVLGAALGALAIGTLTDLFSDLALPGYLVPATVGLLLLLGLRFAPAGDPVKPAFEPPAMTPWPRYLPALIATATLALAALLGFGNAILHIDPLLMLVVTLLAIAMASVIVIGHIDLSVPAIIGFAALATAQLSQGSDAALLWVVPAILLAGGLIGWANGQIGRRLQAPLVLTTLATAGALNSVTLFVASKFFLGATPLAIKNFLMNMAGVPEIGFLVLAVPLLLALAAFRWRSIQRWLQHMSDPAPQARSRASYPWVFAASGLLAAALGIMLPGYAGAISLTAPDPFMLPALLAVQLAGLCIARRGGNPIMIALTVPAVLLIDIVLVGLGVPAPFRTALLGAILLASIALHGAAPLRRVARRLGKAA
ncbi:ABC transporter permease subunit [Hypericibacter adhaerens]|uniref:ABC transporter permease subunit n=2 Tax=Hypericibacter adhaerens TaxID=2602016 RepID=UPI00177E0003|nr:hypothetical protein [Hypericibacter adhaerens]